MLWHKLNENCPIGAKKKSYSRLLNTKEIPHCCDKIQMCLERDLHSEQK